MAYIQFPWRFLTVSLFFLSLLLASLTQKSPRWLIPICLVIAIASTGSFFRPDIWQNITDYDISSGGLWDQGRSSSLSDYWPKYGSSLPRDFAPSEAIGISGEVVTGAAQKNSSSANYDILVNSKSAQVALPIVYFPNWSVKVNGQEVAITPTSELGLISFPLTYGEYKIEAKFLNTSIRKSANVISLLTLSAIIIYWFTYAIKSRRNHY